jgi:hypothetical protein
VRFQGALKWLPLPAAALFYGDFIARSKVEVAGRGTFLLFDDAMISMTYARNLAEGHGLVWGDGQRVEGYSNLLWTLLLSGAHLLPLRDATTALVVMIGGALILLATIVVTGRIVGELAPGRPLLEATAMLLTGFCYPLVFWTLRGFEVGLAALLVALMVLLSLRLTRRFSAREALALGGAMAAVVLTRDELLVPCLLVGGFLAWSAAPATRRSLAIRAGAPVLVAAIGHVIFRLAYYGDALPHPYYLKLGNIPLETRLDRGLVASGYAVTVELYAPLLLAAAYFVFRRRSVPRGALLAAALVLFQFAYSLWVGGDFVEPIQFANRYLSTAAPLLMVLAALGIGELIDGAWRSWAQIAVGAGFVVAAALVAKDWLPTDRLAFPPHDGLVARRLAVALVFAVVVFLVPLILRRLPDRARTAGGAAAVLGLAALVLLQVDGRAVGDWRHDGPQGLQNEIGWAGYGAIIRRDTDPGTRVAMTGAGALAYFAHRPGVDLLGKMDRTIAHEHGRTSIRFHPGHNKWDYDHSLGRLRPEVVTELWYPNNGELCKIAAWGYRQVAPAFYVRRGAAGIHPALARDIRSHSIRAPVPAPVGCG